MNIVNVAFVLIVFSTFSQASVVSDIDVCGSVVENTVLTKDLDKESQILYELESGTTVCFNAQAYPFLRVSKMKIAGKWMSMPGWVFAMSVDITLGKVSDLPNTSSFHLKDMLVPGCTPDHPWQIVGDDILVVNPDLFGMLGVVGSEFAELDKIITDAMGMPSGPIVYWVITHDAPEVSEFFPVLKEYSGYATNLFFDGCNFSHKYPGESGRFLHIAAILYDPEFLGWTFGAILHERSHTLGAVHGAAMAQYTPFEGMYQRSVVGPDDAYLWSDIGRYAFEGRCQFLAVFGERMCYRVELDVVARS